MSPQVGISCQCGNWSWIVSKSIDYPTSPIQLELKSMVYIRKHFLKGGMGIEGVDDWSYCWSFCLFPCSWEFKSGGYKCMSHEKTCGRGIVVNINHQRCWGQSWELGDVSNQLDKIKRHQPKIRQLFDIATISILKNLLVHIVFSNTKSDVKGTELLNMKE